MGIQDIISFFKQSSSVFYRYYLAPSKLIDDNTNLKEAASFSILLIGFFFSLPFITFSTSINFHGKAIDNQSALKLGTELIFFSAASGISIFYGALQVGLSKLRGVSVPISRQLVRNFYCFNLWYFTVLLLIYALHWVNVAGIKGKNVLFVTEAVYIRSYI
jgi:hypothetical protein